MLPIGEISALLAALSWAIGLSLFRVPLRERGAAEVNFFKCAVGMLLFWITAFILAPGDPLCGMSPRQLLLLALSGIIGMSLGDSFLFIALNRIGSTRAIMLQSTNPIMAATLAWVCMAEHLSPLKIAGIVAAILGTMWVVADRSSGGPVAVRGSWVFGIVAGLLAAAGQAIGLVIVRGELGSHPPTTLLLPACSVRLSASALGLLCWSLYRHPGRVLPLFASGRAWRQMGIATFFGTFLGILFMIGGIMNAKTGVVSALTSTTPIFLMLIGVVFLRERHGPFSICGVTTGVGGIILLVM